MQLDIVHAATDARLAEVRGLLAEYGEFIASHWPSVDREAFAEELRDLATIYDPILLALAEDGTAAGCVMLREGVGEHTCEVRRLYVRPAYRRIGVASALTERLTAEARVRGYRRMQLVTTIHFSGAVQLYETLGFVAVEPYRPSMMPLEVVRFMERPLQ